MPNQVARFAGFPSHAITPPLQNSSFSFFSSPCVRYLDAATRAPSPIMLQVITALAPSVVCLTYLYFERRKGHKDDDTTAQDCSNTLLRRDCDVCLEEQRPTYQEPLTLACTHELACCVACIRRFVDTRIYDGGPVRCVDAACSEVLSYESIRRVASGEAFELYDSRLTHALLEAQEEFVWCARPNCGNGVLYENRERTPVLRCDQCRARTCVAHRLLLADCAECSARYEDERDRRREDQHRRRGAVQSLFRGRHENGRRRVQVRQQLEIQANERALQNGSIYKQCPKCRQGIEKNEGCNHMTCRCGFQFCWQCLSGNGDHAPKCPLLRGRHVWAWG